MATEYYWLADCAVVKAEHLGELALTYVRLGNARAAFWYAMLAAHQAGHYLHAQGEE